MSSGYGKIKIIPGSDLDKALKKKKAKKIKVKKGSDLEKALKPRFAPLRQYEGTEIEIIKRSDLAKSLDKRKKEKQQRKKSKKPTEAEKKKAIAKLKKKLKALKKKEEKEAKKAVIEELPELKALTGLNKTEANKLSPLALFGMLPKELSLNIVLNPKATGVKVGEPVPYTKAQADMINTIFNEIYLSEGAYKYVYGWSGYEGGNFNEFTNEFFENTSERLGKASQDMISKVEKLLNPERVRKTGREYGMDLLKDYGITSKYGEEWYMNDDFDVYDVEEAIGLIYDDGEYFSSNIYKPRTRKFIKEYIDDLNKIAKPKLAELKKSLKK